MLQDVQQLITECDNQGYIVEEELATVLLLALKLKKPLLLEGPPGVGKTEAAHILAANLQTKLIRLQCYEGLDVNTAIYEWNYQKQLLSIKIAEQSGLSPEEKEQKIFGDEYLLKRPLLEAITDTDQPPVLLIDEIDRADEEFEAFLLELLSDFQITIPEMGTIRATHKPVVLLTSNRTRELSDALKRRCLFHWIPYPDFKKENEIIKKKIPGIEPEIAANIIQFVQHLRTLKLQKSPGVSEMLDWANGLLALHVQELTEDSINKTLGCLLKSASDLETVNQEGLKDILLDLKAS